MQESFRFLRIQSPDRFFCRIGLASCLAGHLRLSKKHSHAHQGEKHDAGNECFHGQDPFPSSKSSIKGDVKKQVLPRPESRFVSRDPAHFPSASLGRFCLLILISFSATGDDAIEFVRAASQQWLSVSVGSEEARLRASLRPPLKLYVPISGIQLSRRHPRAGVRTERRY